MIFLQLNCQNFIKLSINDAAIKITLLKYHLYFVLNLRYYIFTLSSPYRKQKIEKEARIEELKNSAPSDDIFDQLPETFESAPIAKSTKVSTRTEFVENESEEVN